MEWRVDRAREQRWGLADDRVRSEKGRAASFASSQHQKSLPIEQLMLCGGIREASLTSSTEKGIKGRYKHVKVSKRIDEK